FALTRVGGRPARAEGLDAADIERGDLDRVEALAELDAFAHAGRRAVERLARAGERRHAVDVDLVALERSTGLNLGLEQCVLAFSPGAGQPDLRRLDLRQIGRASCREGVWS